MRSLLRVASFCLLAFAAAGSAHSAPADDVAAIERGRTAVAFIQGYACPRPGAIVNVPGLENEAAIARVQDENLTFVRSRQQARAQALRARDLIAAELGGDGRPSASMRRSFDELDQSLSALDYRAANALVQWALASIVQISRADPDYDILSRSLHPLATFVPAQQNAAVLARQFGGVGQAAAAKVEDCLVEANDSYIELAAPLIRERAARMKRSADLTELLSQLSRFPIAHDLPGGKVYLEIQARQSQLAEDEAHAVALAKARADKAARDRLVAQANRGLAVARRYVAAINAGQIDAAASLLTDDVFLFSPKGNAQGRAAVGARMREASSKGSAATLLAPELTSDYRIVSRIRSDQRDGVMSFQASGDRISRIELSQ